MRPALLVLASGQAEYRQYMLERISRRYDIVLLTPEPVTWEHPFVADSKVVATGDDQATLAAASALAQRHRFAGVLTYHEPCVGVAALVAESLGLSHCDPHAVARCRDKLASRQAFGSANVPSARATLVTDGQAAELAARQIGYPVVVKPRSLAASPACRLSLASGGSVNGSIPLWEQEPASRSVTSPDTSSATGSFRRGGTPIAAGAAPAGPRCGAAKRPAGGSCTTRARRSRR
jgi:hypothetical protein